MIICKQTIESLKHTKFWRFFSYGILKACKNSYLGIPGILSPLVSYRMDLTALFECQAWDVISANKAQNTPAQRQRRQLHTDTQSIRREPA